MGGYRIGADIGGTFTDIAMLDAAGRTLAIEKRVTTPERPDDAVVAGIAALLVRTGVAPADVAVVVHGTTLFTNALIQRRGALTALITTEGFRDAVEIGREHRYDMYDLGMERPAPLAPRRRRYEVPERVLADGMVRRTLDEGATRTLARRLAADGIEAAAVCLLHAYAFPAHERAVGEILAQEAPALAVSLSHAVAPEIREYERASTTLANVYVQRIAEDYLGRLAARLGAEAGIAAPLYVMQSNGGLADVATAQRLPIRLVESGPAAGAIAAAHHAGQRGPRDLISFDMGGTTAKAAVIVDAQPLTAPDFEVDRRYRFKKGSGLPVKTPVIELIEIGTGGGSIAALDALGRLRVGPASAGAVPGPACYGAGGTAPTVTDADLVMGYLDPGFFAGGSMALDRTAAEAALAPIATALGTDALGAAVAVGRMADEAMAGAARLHAVERGVDAAKLALYAFGGAGPVHAWGVARILGSPSVIYPAAAGVVSAIGFLAAPLARDFVATIPAGSSRALEALDWDAARAAVAAQAAEGRAGLTGAVAPGDMRARLNADMRYALQGFEIPVTVPLPEGTPTDDPSPALTPALAGPLAEAFEAAYTALYGHTVPNAAIEVATWRVVVEGPRPPVAIDPPSADGAAALKGSRPAWIPAGSAAGGGGGAGRLAEVPVYDRYALGPGTVLEGPAIVEEREATAVIAGPARITVEPDGTLVAVRGTV
ncbi:MAG: hydantoinase/oxoprolinase family protein [Pseudomonadota bacterium]